MNPQSIFKWLSLNSKCKGKPNKCCEQQIKKTLDDSSSEDLLTDLPHWHIDTWRQSHTDVYHKHNVTSFQNIEDEFSIFKITGQRECVGFDPSHIDAHTSSWTEAKMRTMTPGIDEVKVWLYWSHAPDFNKSSASSTNMMQMSWIKLDNSFMNIMNNGGPITDPCGLLLNSTESRLSPLQHLHRSKRPHVATVRTRASSLARKMLCWCLNDRGPLLCSQEPSTMLYQESFKDWWEKSSCLQSPDEHNKLCESLPVGQ